MLRLFLAIHARLCGANRRGAAVVLLGLGCLVSVEACHPAAPPAISLDESDGAGSTAAAPSASPIAIASPAPTAEEYRQFLPPFFDALPPEKQAGLVVEAKQRAAALRQTPTPKRVVPDKPPTVTFAGGLIDLEHPRQAVVQTLARQARVALPVGLVDVSFSSAMVGLGVTAGGAIYRTRDAGTSWERVHYVDAARLAQVQMVTEAVAVAIGWTACTVNCDGPAVVLRTLDGGDTWEAFEPRAPERYAPAWPVLQYGFLSADVGFAAVDPDENYYAPNDIGGRIMRTDDGGRTWRLLDLPNGVSATGGMSFLSPSIGFATAIHRVSPAMQEWETQVLATTDGGSSWRVIYAGRTGRLYAVDFLDERTGFAAGGSFGNTAVNGPGLEQVLATTDGGASWSEVLRREEPGSRPVTRMSFADRLVGWLATGGWSKMGASGPCGGSLSVTRDGGRTWTPTGQGAIRFSAAGHGLWSVGPADGRPNGANASGLLRSLDAGTTWDTVAAMPNPPTFFGTQLVSQALGWVSGSAGALRTTDGGARWTGSPLVPSPLVAITAADAAARYTPPAGRSSEPRLERTFDGGRTWTPLAMPPVPQADRSHASIAFLDGSRGWLATSTYCGGVSYCPLVLHATRDGGQTWEQRTAALPRVDPGLEAPLLAFGDEDHGAAIFAGGEHLLLTRDGGHTWVDQPLRGVLKVSSVSYRGSLEIWAAGQLEGHGVLLHSADAGHRWEIIHFDAVQPGAIAFTVAGDGWMTGRIGERTGGVLVTRDGGYSWIEVQPELAAGESPSPPKR